MTRAAWRLTITAVLAAATAATAAAGEPPLPAPAPAAPPAAERPVLAGLIEGLAIEPLPEGASVLPRHDTAGRRLLRYEGSVRETVAVRAGGRVEVLSARNWRFSRTNLVGPAGDGLAELWSRTEAGLVEAAEAGRDRLELFRQRPSRGLRGAAFVRRLGPRGAEPAGTEQSIEHRLSPVPEFPRLPALRLSAGRGFTRESGGYLVSWSLTGAARLGQRHCWLLRRTVGPAPGGNAPPALGAAEYLLDDTDFTVLAAVEEWTFPPAGGPQLREHRVEVRLTDDGERPDQATFAAEAARTESDRELLAAVAARDVAEAGRLLAASGGARPAGPAADLARRFVAAERELTAAPGGARRVELVPEDTFALVRAPEKLVDGQKLVPAVFFHGAAAEAATYFADWERRAGDRPLLLVFPQSRDWTWSAAGDGPVVGSLLEVLGRTYDLDRGRLVLAGHGAGAEMAFVLAYGAEFPGYRARGVAAAAGMLDDRLRARAYEQKPPELLERLRAVDVLLLGGRDDRTVKPDALRNLARWLESFNPGGVSIGISEKLGAQYSADWTPEILDWILKLPAAKAPAPAPGAGEPGKAGPGAGAGATPASGGGR